ncbi:hypothetical protein FACS189434_09860 [Bacteroidia bacterium]|nr:hypothetical protein FACS189434_09860 [Bacteroidia bacterium]
MVSIIYASMTSANAQLSISEMQGVRVPRLTAIQRNSINAINAVTAKGQTVFNTDNKCFEYWNGEKWVSICNGTLNLTLSPDTLLPKDIGAGGEELVGPITPGETPMPSCSATEPYSIVIVSGAAFISVDIVDPSSGTFTYRVEENNTALARTGIIRISNNCTKEFQDFLITQAPADICGDGTNIAGTPIIDISGTSSHTAGTLCANGVVYLSVSNAASLTVTSTEDYVWAHNGEEVGRGLTCVATLPGSYELFLGGVGCTNHSDKAIITYSTTPAPKKQVIVDKISGGMICDGNAVTITALNPITSDENVYWYINGNKEGSTGITKGGILGIGDAWTAVVENSVTGCTSVVSNQVITVEGGPAPVGITASDMLINGTPLTSNPAVCKGSTLALSVLTPNPLYTYTWHVNGVSLENYGSNTTYTASEDDEILEITCVVGPVDGYGCVTSVSAAINLNLMKPAKPTIAASASFVCTSSSTLLSVASPGSGLTYTWFNSDGQQVATGNTYEAFRSGDYTVQANLGTCRSDLSAARHLDLRGTPTGAVFAVVPESNYYDFDFPFQATANDAEKWTWNNPSSGLKTAEVEEAGAATYRWATYGTYTVTATASNICGSAAPISAALIVKSYCLPTDELTAAVFTPAFNYYAALFPALFPAGTAYTNTTFTLSSSFDGTTGNNAPGYKVQWQRRALTAAPDTWSEWAYIGSEQTDNFTATYSEAAVGTYQYRCNVWSECDAAHTGTKTSAAVQREFIIDPTTLPSSQQIIIETFGSNASRRGQTMITNILNNTSIAGTNTPIKDSPAGSHIVIEGVDGRYPNENAAATVNYNTTSLVVVGFDENFTPGTDILNYVKEKRGVLVVCARRATAYQTMIRNFVNGIGGTSYGANGNIMASTQESPNNGNNKWIPSFSTVPHPIINAVFDVGGKKIQTASGDYNFYFNNTSGNGISAPYVTATGNWYAIGTYNENARMIVHKTLPIVLVGDSRIFENETPTNSDIPNATDSYATINARGDAANGRMLTNIIKWAIDTHKYWRISQGLAP